MARRYDTRTTTFSPEGRLYQVEYALEAINNAASTIGITTTEGVVLAAEKMETSKLLDPGRTSEKIYKIDEHVICAVAGLTSDANILIESLRETAQRLEFFSLTVVKMCMRQIYFICCHLMSCCKFHHNKLFFSSSL
eukprot:GHVL01024017.1.p1 GENE.GHVL01024017.1~~GHVL01024017.1.p1  ORF type:complete len:137 (+),score=15.69 GHVL01024017.1:34-444(+)